MLGVQVHFQCDVHKLPLIISLEKQNVVVINNSIICVLVKQNAIFFVQEILSSI